MANDKEVIVASALVVIFYWLFINKSVQAAVTAEGINQAISAEQAIFTKGTTKYASECSRIFIEYPGLAIFTPCTNNSV